MLSSCLWCVLAGRGAEGLWGQEGQEGGMTWRREAEGIRVHRIVTMLCDFEKPFKLLSLSQSLVLGFWED